MDKPDHDNSKTDFEVLLSQKDKSSKRISILMFIIPTLVVCAIVTYFAIELVGTNNSLSAQNDSLSLTVTQKDSLSLVLAEARYAEKLTLISENKTLNDSVGKLNDSLSKISNTLEASSFMIDSLKKELETPDSLRQGIEKVN